MGVFWNKLFYNKNHIFTIYMNCWKWWCVEINICWIKISCLSQIWNEMVLKSKNGLYIYIIKIYRITKLQFVFWNREFKRLVREIRPSDFPKTATVGVALEISFQRHQLCKDPTVGLSGMFNSNLKKNNAKIDYNCVYNYN